MKKYVLFLAILLIVPSIAKADIGSFSLETLSKKDFRTFVEVFSEMRGPLRVEILKASKTNFENADPLAYVEKIKNEKDVQGMLKKHDLSWDSFSQLMGNVLIAYLSTQPEKTKVALIKQMSSYGLTLADDKIPEEYRGAIKEVLKTDTGAQLAGFLLEQAVQIPQENIKLVTKNKRTLDQLFYTRFWKDKI